MKIKLFLGLDEDENKILVKEFERLGINSQIIPSSKTFAADTPLLHVKHCGTKPRYTFGKRDILHTIQGMKNWD